jgi:aspartate oxidase
MSFYLTQVTLPNVRKAYTANYLKDITEYLISEIKYLSSFIADLQLIYIDSTNTVFNSHINQLVSNIDQNVFIFKNLHQKSILYNYLELENLLINSLAVAFSALNRLESRGSHYRFDYPLSLDEFKFHSLVVLKDFEKFVMEFNLKKVNNTNKF